MLKNLRDTTGVEFSGTAEESGSEPLEADLDF